MTGRHAAVVVDVEGVQVVAHVLADAPLTAPAVALIEDLVWAAHRWVESQPVAPGWCTGLAHTAARW